MVDVATLNLLVLAADLQSTLEFFLNRIISPLHDRGNRMRPQSGFDSASHWHSSLQGASSSCWILLVPCSKTEANTVFLHAAISFCMRMNICLSPSSSLLT